MQGFDAYTELRNTERYVPRKPRKCDECGRVKDDVDLFGEDEETCEQIYMCPLCVGKEEMTAHVAQGLDVECLVKFDGQKTENCLPLGWFISHTYGTLLKDGRVMWGDREVKPPSYERIAD